MRDSRYAPLVQGTIESARLIVMWFVVGAREREGAKIVTVLIKLSDLPWYLVINEWTMEQWNL